MEMRLRFSESDINDLANGYTEYQEFEGGYSREREDQVIGFRDEIQRRGYLTKYELYKVADWKLSVYGEDAAEPTLKNPEDLIRVTTKQAFTSTDDWGKLLSLTEQLRDIGQSTASAILHLYDAGQYPILDIHALWSAGLEKKKRTSYPF